MSDRRIFVHPPLPAGGLWLPEPEVVHYLERVLRARPGEAFRGFDSSGTGYGLQWRGPSEGFAVLERSDPLHTDRPTLGLAQGIPKGPKFESVLRECTEAGVDLFFPLLTERTVVRLDPEEREGKRRRWDKVLQESCRQCGRDDLPTLSDPLPWKDFLGHLGAFDLAVLLYEEGKETLRSALEGTPRAQRILLLVGPEGGWAPREVGEATALGVRPVRLPTPILRAEHAPLAAVSMVRYHLSGASQRP